MASITQLLSQPIETIKTYLTQYGAELKETKYPETYLIKFDPQTQAYHPAVNQLRGIIFRHSETGSYLYSLGYPVPIEYKDQTPEEQMAIVDHIKATTYTVQEALDGTLVRLWYHNETNKWMLATNSKEDAYDSYWMNNISFGDLFETALQNNLDNLNPNYVYLFSLCHPMNIIVVNHTTANMYHLTTIDRTTLKEVEVDLGVKRPPTFQMTVDDAMSQVIASVSTPVNSAGYVVVCTPSESGMARRYRFENVNYTRARILRGDSNNIETIILQHLLGEAVGTTSTMPANLAEFLQYYPVYQQAYCGVVKRINSLVSYIFNCYNQRYKARQEIVIAPRHHHFLKDMHQQLYLSHLRPQGRSMTQTDVTNYIYNQLPSKVSYLIEIM